MGQDCYEEKTLSQAGAVTEGFPRSCSGCGKDRATEGWSGQVRPGWREEQSKTRPWFGHQE